MKNEMVYYIPKRHSAYKKTDRTFLSPPHLSVNIAYKHKKEQL